VLINGEIVGKEMREEVKRYKERKKSHLIINEYINRELKKI
jgi:hypothetical protein